MNIRYDTFNLGVHILAEGMANVESRAILFVVARKQAK
jgi:hypothetical protein